MQYWHLTVLVLAVNGSLSFVNAIPVNGLYSDSSSIAFQLQPNNNWNMTAAGEEWQASQQNVGQTSLGYGDVWGGLTTFLGIVANTTVTFPWMLASWGLPVPLIVLFSSMTWASYAAAGAHFLSSRNIEK